LHSLTTRNPALARYPQLAFRRFGKTHDLGTWQSVAMTEGAEAVSVISEKPVLGSNP
jgi:hypothetical protein